MSCESSSRKMKDLKKGTVIKMLINIPGLLKTKGESLKITSQNKTLNDHVTELKKVSAETRFILCKERIEGIDFEVVEEAK